MSTTLFIDPAGKCYRQSRNGSRVRVPDGLARERGWLSDRSAGGLAAIPTALDRLLKIPQARSTAKPSNRHVGTMRAFLAKAPATAAIALGYASIFWRQFPLGPEPRDGVTFVEPGCFSSQLDRDVSALIDHRWERKLGNSNLGTVFLVEDDLGLLVAISIDPKREFGLIERTARGDLAEMSVGSFVRQKPGDRGPATAQLVEVSLVELGANRSTCFLLLDTHRLIIGPPRCRTTDDFKRQALGRLLTIADSAMSFA